MKMYRSTWQFFSQNVRSGSILHFKVMHSFWRPCRLLVKDSKPRRFAQITKLDSLPNMWRLHTQHESWLTAPAYAKDHWRSIWSQHWGLWLNEWLTELMKQWLHGGRSDWMEEWLNEGVTELMQEWFKEHIKISTPHPSADSQQTHHQQQATHLHTLAASNCKNEHLSSFSRLTIHHQAYNLLTCDKMMPTMMTSWLVVQSLDDNNDQTNNILPPISHKQLSENSTTCEFAWLHLSWGTSWWKILPSAD